MLDKKILPRVIAILLFLSVVAGTWDAWWHGAIGRDSFFEPPHLLLYTTILFAIFLGIYGFKKYKDKLWKRLALTLSLIIIAAPFDELWHRIFGVEDITSPLIVWSPPHLAIVFATAASILMILPIIKKDSKEIQILFGGMMFAALLSLLLFVVSPLQPEGPWHLLGFYGSGFIALLLVGIFYLSEKWTNHKGGAMITAAFFLSLSAISFNERIVEGIKFLPHSHSVSFLIVFSVLLLAASISIFSKKNKILTGALAGFLWSILIYGFSWVFFEPEFVYTFTEGMIAVISATIGGILSIFFINKFSFKI